MSSRTIGIAFAALIALGGIAQAVTGNGLNSAQAAGMFRDGKGIHGSASPNSGIAAPTDNGVHGSAAPNSGVVSR